VELAGLASLVELAPPEFWITVKSRKEPKIVREKYKGFYLNVGANKLQYDLGYSPRLTIEKHHGDCVTATEIISVRGVYGTQDEAIDAALAHGHEGIDRGFQVNPPIEELPQPLLGHNQINP
jgi:hypothetical protein